MSFFSDEVDYIINFVATLDVIYNKNIPIAVTANQNLDQFTSSHSLENQFKRTVSRLYELTSAK